MLLLIGGHLKSYLFSQKTTYSGFIISSVGGKQFYFGSLSIRTDEWYKIKSGSE